MSRWSCRGGHRAADATDFNKTLIMTDLEWQLFGHLHGHFYLELGTGVRSDSSNSTLKSASRHFHLRQPCLPTSPLPVPSAPFGRSAVQLDVPVVRGGKHLDLVAQGRPSICKASYGCEWSVRWLLVGTKAPNRTFSSARSRWAPRTPRAWRARASEN
jgi:hypothetical protein